MANPYHDKLGKFSDATRTAKVSLPFRNQETGKLEMKVAYSVKIAKGRSPNGKLQAIVGWGRGKKLQELNTKVQLVPSFNRDHANEAKAALIASRKGK